MEGQLEFSINAANELVLEAAFLSANADVVISNQTEEATMAKTYLVALTVPDNASASKLIKTIQAGLPEGAQVLNAFNVSAISHESFKDTRSTEESLAAIALALQVFREVQAENPGVEVNYQEVLAQAYRFVKKNEEAEQKLTDDSDFASVIPHFTELPDGYDGFLRTGPWREDPSWVAVKVVSKTQDKLQLRTAQGVPYEVVIALTKAATPTYISKEGLRND